MKFAKLITEAECLCFIKGKHNEKEIKDIFLEANIKTLMDHLAKCIVQANLLKGHHYRFKIQVHAQEVEVEKPVIKEKSK